MRIAIGSDHAGYALKEELKKFLADLGYTYEDFGAFNNEPGDDYPDFAVPVAKAVSEGKFERGVLFCGSAVGMVIAANKIKGVRALAANETYTARMSRADDDTNVLALAARVVGPELAKDILRIWLDTEFSGEERHRRRLRKIAELEGG